MRWFANQVNDFWHGAFLKIILGEISKWESGYEIVFG